MKTTNITNDSKANFTSVKHNEKTNERTIKKTQKEDKKKLFLALASLSILGITAVVTANKFKQGQLTMSFDSFKNIGNFNGGMALINGKPYTGTIENTLKNGDKIKLKYVNGLIKSSKRTGSKSFIKTFVHDNLGKISSVKTKSGGNISDFIKTDKRHIIKENGKLKKAFVKKENRSFVVDFIDGKPVNSTEYNQSLKPYMTKQYSYNDKGKLENIVISRKNNFLGEMKLEKTIQYSPNGGSKIIKHDIYGDRVVKEIKTSKDRKLPYDADVSVYERKELSPITKYYKDGKLITAEEQIVDSIYAPSGNHAVGLQNPHTKYKYINVLDYRTGKTTHKRIYDDGSSDILTKGHKFSSGCEIEHINSSGKTTGYSRITEIDQCDISDKYSEIYSTYYKDELLDLNHNVISTKHDYYTDKYFKSND